MRKNHAEFTPEVLNVLCPVHGIRPLINTATDYRTIRCCCESSKDKYVLTVVDKIKGSTITKLLDGWEADLLLSEAMNAAEQLYA